MVRIPGKISGMALRHLLKKPDTIAYPEGKLIIEPNYRGRLVFEGEHCIGCQLCVRDCPAAAIKITNIGSKEAKKFVCELDLGRCIFCSQCVDSCNKGCLHFTKDIELAGLKKEDLLVTME